MCTYCDDDALDDVSEALQAGDVEGVDVDGEASEDDNPCYRARPPPFFLCFFAPKC